MTKSPVTTPNGERVAPTSRSSGPLSFFTIDHGSATVAAALIGPVAGRFRLLASGVAPRGVSVEAVLAEMVRHVLAVAPHLLRDAHSWPDWARLETATHKPPSIVCAGESERSVDSLAAAFGGAGWVVSGRLVAGRSDALAATAACLEGDVGAVAIAADRLGTAPPTGRVAELWSALAAVTGRRPDLTVILAGGAASLADSFPPERTVSAPAPEPWAGGSITALGDTALALASLLGGGKESAVPDGRLCQRACAVSLAQLLSRPVDLVDVGAAAGAHVATTPSGALAHTVDPDAALVPPPVMRDDATAERILRWASLRHDPFALRDRLRNLHLDPWRDTSEEAARLRLAGLRAALQQLSQHSAAARRERNDKDPATGLLVASGGAFAAIPAHLASLTLLDAYRRPGALAMVWDHARLLAPIGTLELEADRRRLLGDLLDDALLPLGSAIVAGRRWNARLSMKLRMTTAFGTSQVELAPGTLRLLDLPPGLMAHAELDTAASTALGRGRTMTFDVLGGLAGLLIDTREHPLRLPQVAEEQRALFDGWERLYWPAGSAVA